MRRLLSLRGACAIGALAIGALLGPTQSAQAVTLYNRSPAAGGPASAQNWVTAGVWNTNPTLPGTPVTWTDGANAGSDLVIIGNATNDLWFLESGANRTIGNLTVQQGQPVLDGNPAYPGLVFFTMAGTGPGVNRPVINIIPPVLASATPRLFLYNSLTAVNGFRKTGPGYAMIGGNDAYGVGSTITAEAGLLQINMNAGQHVYHNKGAVAHFEVLNSGTTLRIGGANNVPGTGTASAFAGQQAFGSLSGDAGTLFVAASGSTRMA
ncbi:MAG: hypothetical protein SGJ20_19545 [Planctomycetota bacterium]|nr:hypothetical protein [Planctomycetota bacterium]